MTIELAAKVANILDSRRVSLNVGKTDGVSQGDRVMLWRTVEVTDPDSNEVLGSVRLEKLALEIESVEPRFAVATVARSSDAWAFLLSSRRRISTRESEDSITIYPGEEVTVYLGAELTKTGSIRVSPSHRPEQRWVDCDSMRAIASQAIRIPPWVSHC